MQAHYRDECALTLPSPCSKTVHQTATPHIFPPCHATNALPPKSPSLVPRYQSNLIAPKCVNHVQLTSA